MPYTTEDGGRLNNFAQEPRMYQSEPPSTAQKRNYAIIAVLSLGLIGGVLALAFYVS